MSNEIYSRAQMSSIQSAAGLSNLNERGPKSRLLKKIARRVKKNSTYWSEWEALRQAGKTGSESAPKSKKWPGNAMEFTQPFKDYMALGGSAKTLGKATTKAREKGAARGQRRAARRLGNK